VVDLAAMRDAITRLGGNPDKINPLVSWKILHYNQQCCSCFLELY
jgi:aconitase A